MFLLCVFLLRCFIIPFRLRDRVFPRISVALRVVWLALCGFGEVSPLEAGVDDLVGLHGGDEDVGDPEEDEYARGDDLDAPGASELAVAEFAPSQEDHDGAHRKTAKQRHGEAQAGNQSRNSL